MLGTYTNRSIPGYAMPRSSAPLSRAEIFGLGLTAGQKASRSFWSGIRFGGAGILFGAGIAAFEAAHADRGEKLPTLIGKGAAAIMYPAMAGAAAAPLALIPGIGPIAAVVLASILVAYPNEAMGNSITRGVRMFTNLNKSIRHLEMGGNYKDTELAYRQRQIAVQDMNAALIPGRRYLGQEALLMHR